MEPTNNSDSRTIEYQNTIQSRETVKSELYTTNNQLYRRYATLFDMLRLKEIFFDADIVMLWGCIGNIFGDGCIPPLKHLWRVEDALLPHVRAKSERGLSHSKRFAMLKVQLV